MIRNKERWILIIWLSLTVMHVKILSARSWNWFEAQELCEQNNDSLPNPKTYKTETEELWTSHYRRYSLWIKILGCFNDTNPDDRNTLQMSVPSAGFCQEFCRSKKASIFGIKKKKCKCFGKLSFGQPVSSDYCNTEHRQPGEIRYTESGNTNTYILYESSVFNLKKRNEIYCVAVQCQNHTRFFFEPLANCSLLYSAVCQNSVSESYQNWTSSMETCTKNNSSYLAGNVSLNNVNETCDSLNVTLTGPAWLGVAKEFYTGFDLGVSLSNNEEASFLQCETCAGEFCHYFDCKKRLKAVYCKTGFITRAVETTNNPGTMQSVLHTSESSIYNLEKSTYTAEISTNFNVSVSVKSSVIPINKQDASNSSNSLAIILPSVLTTIFIGCFATAAIFYIRRKRGLGNQTKRQLDSKDTDNCYTDIDIDVKNKNYFVLEQQSITNQNESHVNYTSDSNPYKDTAEGVYDHLRDKESRKRREDEGNLRDSDPYKHIAEGIYDHLKDKESGKINKGDGKVMDSNPYKETKGGVYDHLREKESGKFTEENNYDHTPATTGKEYCAQGGMDEHTADTDYDHAMPFYNHKQHNQVIEETDGGYAKTVNVS